MGWDFSYSNVSIGVIKATSTLLPKRDGRQPHFNKSVLDDLLQHPIFEGCDHLPTDKEIIDSTHKLKKEPSNKSGIMA